MMIRFFVVFMAVFHVAGTTWAAPKVVATIRPLHSLAAQVMAGAGTPELLLDGAASPHSYAMKPSDARALFNADVIVWTGETMETFLLSTMPSLAAKARIIAAAEMPGVRLLPIRGTGNDENRTERHADWDPHLWLDPENAAAITVGLAAVLSEIDPANAERYRANARQAGAAIAALAARLDRRLEPVQGMAYIAAHDAYQYFDTAFGFVYEGAVVAHPGRPPSARHLRRLNDAIEKAAVSCLVTEPHYLPPLIARLAQEAGMTIVEADPLGLNLATGPDFYERLMESLAESFRTCLGPLTQPGE